MALESVDYSEEKACKILEIVLQDDKSAKEEAQQEVKGDACVDNETAPPMVVPSDSTESAEPIADVVDHEERYDDFFIQKFIFFAPSCNSINLLSHKLLHC